MTAGDLADQCQAQSAAATVLGGLGEAIERLEDALALAGRHAGAVVGDCSTARSASAMTEIAIGPLPA